MFLGKLLRAIEAQALESALRHLSRGQATESGARGSGGACRRGGSRRRTSRRACQCWCRGNRLEGG
uniref:Uncharacterized protein n=1 Tax=Arundo donax TaxID=35708 RepID=A0A0A9A899_ARUDO